MLWFAVSIFLIKLSNSSSFDLCISFMNLFCCDRVWAGVGSFGGSFGNDGVTCGILTLFVWPFSKSFSQLRTLVVRSEFCVWRIADDEKRSVVILCDFCWPNVEYSDSSSLVAASHLKNALFLSMFDSNRFSFLFTQYCPTLQILYMVLY